MERSRRRSGTSPGVCRELIFITVMLSVGGCGSGSSSPTAPSGTSTPMMIVYESGSGVPPPTLVREVKPTYTAQAVAAGIQGAVLLSAVVLPNGTVGDVTVLESLDTTFGLDAQAVIAVKQWLFNPSTKDGTAVAFRVTIHIAFTLMSSARADGPVGARSFACERGVAFRYDRCGNGSWRADGDFRNPVSK